MITPADVNALLAPRRIVVIGASNDLDNVGARFVRPMANFGFEGEVVVVHPSETTVLGYPAVPRLSDVESADLVTVAVGPHRVLDALQGLAGTGARFVHVFAGGFSENNTVEGTQLESEIVDYVHGQGAHVIGPNCMGLHRPAHRWTFRDDLPIIEGTVGLIAQSGGIAIAAVRVTAADQSGLSVAWSMGNCADLGLADALEFLTLDDRTHEIAVYAESAGKDGRLHDALRAAAAVKPVRIWVSGTTPDSLHAARMHTGAPGGALLESLADTGAEIVSSLDGLVYGRADPPRPTVPTTPGPNVATVSISGGISVVMTEALERAGMRVPILGPEAQAKLEVIGAPLAGNTANPVDMGGSYLSRGRIGEVVRVLQQDPAIDHVLFHLGLDYIEEVEGRHPGFLVGWLEKILEAMIEDPAGSTLFMWPPNISDHEGLAHERAAQTGITLIDELAQLAPSILARS